MAKAFKGEITVVHEGAVYTAAFDFNALCEFEAATGKNALIALEGLEKGDVTASDLRALAWASMVGHHPDLTLREAGLIFSANPDLVMRAASAAAPAGDAGNAQSPSKKRAK